jgi:ABC-type amino acid transport substrate-binding protein
LPAIEAHGSCRSKHCPRPRRHSNLQYLSLSNPHLGLRVSAAGYQPQNYGFALRLDDDRALAISIGILALQESGELDSIISGWLGR